MGATKLMTAAGGGITLDAASTASDKTITVPARTGNMAVDGPAFSAYKSSNQSISNGTFTKITFDVEEFDTNSNFASNTFTPTVAGYYQLNAALRFDSTTTGTANIFLYKNGSRFKDGTGIPFNTADSNEPLISTLVYANGSTDYFEIYTYQTGGTRAMQSGVSSTWFQGVMVRAA